ncbi:MAG TPA: M48 family metalloprotease, partial [Pyrinomonadaceae bacterium]|nr:M48 family metalloprotease [Pyrinomonadaceae bacterium]
WNYITFKLVWIPLVIAGLVLRSLWVTIPEPDGRELQREQAPHLFDLVDEVKRALVGPEVHKVLLSDEFNAGIVQIPRFGMFGWLTNYLVVGLPLLKAVSPEEFRSILAHEFGHLSGKHGRFSGWIYRVRASWIEILTRIHQERHYASFIFEYFLKWYAPFFNAYSFVLARTQEREADSYSVDLAGKEIAGRSLVRMATKDRLMQEEFWPGFFRQANDEPKAPRDPFSQMLVGLEQSAPSMKAEKWYLEELKVKTGYDDTHPALADRLTAMGFPKESLDSESNLKVLVDPVPELKESAAEVYLKELPDDLLGGYDRLWREQLVKPWSDRHAHVKNTRKQLHELEEKEKTITLTLDEQWERARALADIEDSASALPLLRKIVQQSPDHVGANYGLGAVLLEQNDASGIEYLENALRLDPFAASDACYLIANFHRSHGRSQEAQAYLTRAEEIASQIEQSTTFSKKDRFEAHGLPAAELEGLQAHLRKVRGLNRAYLVRKRVSDTKLIFVLGVVADYTWNEGRSEKNYQALINELSAAVQLSDFTVFAPLEDHQQYLEAIFSKIPGAAIFSSAVLYAEDPKQVRY